MFIKDRINHAINALKAAEEDMLAMAAALEDGAEVDADEYLEAKELLKLAKNMDYLHEHFGPRIGVGELG